MRELEFLPDWYAVLRRRRKLATMQTWTTAALMGGIVLWGVVVQQDVIAQQARGDTVVGELARVRSELKLLDEQLRLKQQLQHQEEMLRKLGLQVDATRLLGELDALMGPHAFLLSLSADVEETVRAPAAVAPAAAPTMSGAAQGEDVGDRLLRLRLVGVAPSDVDVANFLAALTSRPYLERAAMTYARDRVSGGRVMREFEVTFQINLKAPERID